jgi:hypothetical protein
MEHRHTMHTSVVVIIAVALTLLHTAADCFAANPHIGTWRFNEAKSKMHAGVTKNNTVTYSEQGDKIKATTDGTDRDGKPIHSVWVGKFDGKVYPVKGNPYHNAERYRCPPTWGWPDSHPPPLVGLISCLSLVGFLSLVSRLSVWVS